MSVTDRVWWVWLAALGAVVYLLSRLLLLPRFPPFFDEGTYSWWALQGFEHADQRFASLDSQVQPFAMWLAMLFMKLGAAPLTAMRLDSFFGGILTAVCVVLIARRFMGPVVAAVAGGLYVLLPYFVVHDVVGILDPLVVAVGMAALYLQIRLAERPRLDLSLVLGFAFAIGLLTKPTGLYAMILLPLSLLCFDWSRERLAPRLATWCMYAALAVVLGVIGHLITKLSTYQSSLANPNGAAPRTTRPLGQALGHPLRWAGDAWPPLQHALTGYVTWPLLALALVGVVVLWRRLPRIAILLAAWLLLPIVADLLVSQEQFPRLILESVPPIVIFAAVGLVAAFVWAWGRLQHPRRWAVPVCVVLALVPALVLDGSVLASPSTAKYPGLDDFQYATGWASGAPYGAVGRTLRALVGQRHATVVLSEQVSYTLQVDLRNARNMKFIGPDDPHAAKAQYAVVNGDTLPDSDNPSTLVTLATWHRPRGGATMTLLARGVVFKGTFYSDPQKFRDALNLPDAQFDKYMSKHPFYLRWYRVTSHG